MELGTYGSERQEELHKALDQLADAAAVGAGTPDGVGRCAELLPGMDFHWVVLEAPHLAIVWQIDVRG